MTTASSGRSTTSKDKENVMKILVATDIHLGYGEKNPITTDDSFNTFEEILQIANSREVDFILLGGDLFHDPTPSPNSLNKCIKLLRTYILGDKMIKLDFLSDQNQNFPDSFNHSVNYEDMNLNVSIPVFSIHGNHDDISGVGRLSSMDILSSTGLINYFGKWRDLSQVEISPIVLQKNSTKIAIYGLSHIADLRLSHLFRENKVSVRKPDIPDDEIFNLMVLHQNRADRGHNKYIPEEKLPGFLDFVIWGHEHDCRIEPEVNGKIKAYMCQPGSSIATSMSEGESIEKKIGILEICGKEFKMTPVKLKTVRPLIFKTINMDDYAEDLRLNEGDTQKKLTKFFTETVEEMIEESKKRLSGHPKQPTMPLLRLRSMYTDENHYVNQVRFGQIFEKKVANSNDLLKCNKIIKRVKGAKFNINDAALNNAYEKRQQQDSVEDVVESYFNELENEDDKLDLFSLKSLSEVCRLYVTRDDDVAVDTIVQKIHDMAQSFLKEKVTNEEDILDRIHEFQASKSKEAYDAAVIANSTRTPRTQIAQTVSDEEDNTASTSKKPSTAAKSTRGRGSKAATASRGRGKKASPASDTSAFGLDVRTTRGNPSKQLTIQQSTQRSQQSTAAKRKASKTFLSSSDSD